MGLNKNARWVGARSLSHRRNWGQFHPFVPEFPPEPNAFVKDVVWHYVWQYHA
jgi:hypothetical protein